ncbi:MAG: hypothetical protein AABZ08_03455 [Planctomycetota bacterium]
MSAVNGLGQAIQYSCAYNKSMGGKQASLRLRTSWRLKVWYAILAITLALWLGTQQIMIGHIPPDNYCFSVGGGYIEYGYGWDWIRQKMIGHDGMPPQGWFLGKKFDYPNRTFALFCIPFRDIVFVLAAPLYFKKWRPRICQRREDRVGYTDAVVVTFALVLLAIKIDLYSDVMIFFTLGIAVPSVLLLIAFAIWRSGKRVAWKRASREYPICPTCKYPMKGLTTARCPECGNQYTLDDLWQSQRDAP